MPTQPLVDVQQLLTRIPRPKVHVYKDHDDAGILNKIESASRRVDILQVYITNSDIIRPKLQTSFKNGCKIRILILRPGSLYFEDRLNHLATPYLDAQHFAELSYTMLKGLDEELAKKPNPLGGSLEIKVYDFIPYFPYYRIDNHVFTGFFLKDGSHLSPQIRFRVDELERSEAPFSNVLAHFEEFWVRKGNKNLKELGTFESLVKKNANRLQEVLALMKQGEYEAASRLAVQWGDKEIMGRVSEAWAQSLAIQGRYQEAYELMQRAAATHHSLAAE